MELTLLGTGNPQPSPQRAGPSQHLQLGASSVLVDCGAGTARRMVEAKLNPRDVDLVFLTHLHSDHCVDLAHLIISGWVMGRTRPLRVIGPTGTDEFVRRLLHAFEFDLQVRRFAERYASAPDLMLVPVREVGHGDTIQGEDW